MSLRAAALALLFALRAASSAAAAPEEFAYCTVCHGAQGHGNPAIRAPQIAGLEPAYVARQLEAFRAGWRGAQAEDTAGREMRFVAQALPDAAAVKRAVAYVATLAPVPSPRTLEGDAARGAALYAPCSACHGARGEGNAALAAPRLAGQADWYLAAQLEAYRGGRRGADPKDEIGARMQPLAALLADEPAVTDVLAYLATLAPEPKQEPKS